MKPIVLIQRTTAGDSFRYSRIAPPSRERTHIVETEPVPVGTELPALSAEQVEMFRANPEQALA